ncbi:MAG: YceI family protein [FCB group bacterium]
MKLLKYLFLFCILSISQAYAGTTWKFDKSHTSITFNVSHMVITTVTGKFHDFDGSVTSDKDDFQDAKIEFKVETKSVDTDNLNRDSHLKTNDFFASDKYPEMTFKSTSFQKIKGKKYKLTGDFTIRDVTKNITLDVDYNGSVTDQRGNVHAGFRLSGEIDRFDFNMKWDKTLDAGGLIAGREVELICNVELIKQK